VYVHHHSGNWQDELIEVRRYPSVTPTAKTCDEYDFCLHRLLDGESNGYILVQCE